MPSGIDEDLTLKVYRSGTQVATETVNPAYGGSYNLNFTGTSGTENVVVTLNDETYMELEFNFDEPSVQVTRTYDFTLPSTPSDDEESSSQNEESSSNEEPSSEEGQ